MRSKENPVAKQGIQGRSFDGGSIPPGRNETNFKIITEGILGPVEWKDFNSGFCECPGQDLHSTRTAKRDCEIWLGLDEKPPAIHCVHSSCIGAVEEAARELRSQLGKAEATGQRPTREQFNQWRHKANQRKREQRKKELVSKAWEGQLPDILNRFKWPLEQVMEDSPISPRDVWSWVKPERVPEWTRLIDLIFHPGDLVFIGGLRDVGSDHFKPASEWLDLYQKPNAPTLPPGTIFISPWAWREGTASKERSNQLQRRALVLESDSLGENVFPVFKWLSQLLKLRAIVFTGNKSFHGWFDPPPPKLEAELKEAAEALQLDPAMFTNATTRLPGVTRPDAPYESWRQELCFLDRKEVAA